MRVSRPRVRTRVTSLGDAADLPEQPGSGLDLEIDGSIGDLRADDGLEEGNGLLFAAFGSQQLTERHASAGEQDEVLGLDGGVDGIAQGGLSELGPAAFEELTGAEEVAGGIHGENPRATEPRHGTTSGRPGYPRGMEDESRIVELELRYMQQQELLQELSEVLYTQQRELDVLRAEVEQLKKKLQGEPGLVDARQHEKPPHY